MIGEIALEWARNFGLAASPLFTEQPATDTGDHAVLLDGGNGTFALSAGEFDAQQSYHRAAWIWSSDIPHHVSVGRDKVAVVRWDMPGTPRVYGRSGVEKSLSKFYDFLVEDRVRSNKTVVAHLLGLFRRVRSLALESGLDDRETTNVFTAVLDRLITVETGNGIAPNDRGLSTNANELLGRLKAKGLAAAMDEIRCASGSLSMLTLDPGLAIRHAGGQLFQEAHFELLRGGRGYDLLGLIDIPETSQKSRGGTHFTPPSLARSIIEHAFACLPDFKTRDSLTICDPACGSGAFLYEALRALQRAGFQGSVRLIGHDISTAAVDMARFVLARARLDWTPRGGVEVELQVGDSLGALGIPPSDVLVMNPPFISANSQTPEQLEQLKAAVDSSAMRGDYSMAFVIRALESLKLGGVLGTVFPASLLSLKSATSWREKLMDLGEVRFLASMGDFGLFSQAIVQIACMVVSKSGKGDHTEFLALISDSASRSTSDALRQLRKIGERPLLSPILENGWQLFPSSTSSLRERATWKLPTPAAEQGLRELKDAGLPVVEDLFEVSQGVQTGLNQALLLTESEWRQLPAKERHYFRLASMTDTIQNGAFKKPYYVFFPHTPDGVLFNSEAEVSKAVPQYWKTFLLPNRERLLSRASISQTKRDDWWGLMRYRDFAFSTIPRIVSKFFAAEGGFACDVEARIIPVMGHIWIPKIRLTGAGSETDQAENGLALTELLLAYVAILNSEAFIRLLSVFSPHVAGGQFDVSARHVRRIPLPDLRALSVDMNLGSAVRELAALGAEIDLDDMGWRSKAVSLTLKLYGTPSLMDR